MALNSAAARSGRFVFRNSCALLEWASICSFRDGVSENADAEKSRARVRIGVLLMQLFYRRMESKGFRNSLKSRKVECMPAGTPSYSLASSTSLDSSAQNEIRTPS